MRWDLRACSRSVVKGLVEQHHKYGAMGNGATYAFAVYEDEKPVAGFAWQPPPMGSAKTVCPEFPNGVLSLSRMIAVPKAERRLKHISKPLRYQMLNMIDRTRWPVLVTYSDESSGHTGYVYQCSGWERTAINKARIFTDETGTRVSRFRNGSTNTDHLIPLGKTQLQRWEHWICDRGEAAAFVARQGWRREIIPGKVWRSGSQAHKWVKNALG